jgi:hypothetical protein
MNFIEWTKEQHSKNELPSNPKTIKTRLERSCHRSSEIVVY